MADPITSSEADEAVGDDVEIDPRHLELKQAIERLAPPAFLARGLKTWVAADDRHLPQRFLDNTLQQILDPWVWHMVQTTAGVGVGRMRRLLTLIERAHHELVRPTAPPAPPPEEPDAPAAEPGAITEGVWQGWCEVVVRHRLADECLGRFADRLSDLPQGLWDIPLREYAGRPLHEVRTLPGHGPVRVGQVVGVFARIAQTVGGRPGDPPLGVRLLPSRIRDVTLWAEGLLQGGPVPDTATVRRAFVAPLFAQFEDDLGAEAVAMVRRRLGLDGPAETLEEIAAGVGRTRERVRQITAKVAEVVRVRWPEGPFILDNVYAHFQASPGADEQAAVVHAVLDSCFDLDVRRGGSRADVLAAWDRAGRAKRTPMAAAGVRAWAAEEFPHLPAAAVERLLTEEGLREAAPAGPPRFYSNDPLDKLLRDLSGRPEPVPLADVLANEGEGRSLKLRIERDPRFVEDDDKRVLPADRCSFVRTDGRWFLRLVPAPGAVRSVGTVGVSDLVHLVVGALTQAGVCDATVWGVHRLAAAVVRRTYGADLAPAVTPFVLANALVRHSDGLVQPMRRRRLRWDTADGSIPVRGKRGWVGHVAAAAGVPLTLDELDTALRDRFQDYEPYVLKQLHLIEDEDDPAGQEYEFVPGTSNVVPSIVVPGGWRLDPAAANVSTGVWQIVDKVVAMGRRGPVPKAHMRRLPWLLELCDRAAGGTMRWSEQLPVPAEDRAPADPEASG